MREKDVSSVRTLTEIDKTTTTNYNDTTTTPNQITNRKLATTLLSITVLSIPTVNNMGLPFTTIITIAAPDTSAQH